MEGVRSGGSVNGRYVWRIRRGLPAAGTAGLLGLATARGLTLLSGSESDWGSSIRCRLAGFGRVGWRVVTVPLFNQGSVLAIIVDVLDWWRGGRARLEDE